MQLGESIICHAVNVLYNLMKFLLTAPSLVRHLAREDWNLTHSHWHPEGESAFSQCQNSPSSQLPFSHSQPAKRLLPTATVLKKIKKPPSDMRETTLTQMLQRRSEAPWSHFHKNLMRVKSTAHLGGRHGDSLSCLYHSLRLCGPQSSCR